MINSLDKLFDQLWPICRSIAGPGFYQSLQLISEHIPIKINKIKSGKSVFGWIIPQEWELFSAELYTEKGKLILSTKDSNLHVLNYSEPYEGIISYDNLSKHLFTNKDIPEAIPYVTSYYEKEWGLCLSENQRKKLDKNQNYKVKINVKKNDGYLTYGEYLLKGKSDKTILLTTYLCHPSMANNELSGPLVLVALYKHLSNLKDRYFNYKFLIWPETIGAIAFLSKSKKNDLDKIYAGMVLSCLGGPKKKLTLKHSRRKWLGENSEIDRVASFFCQKEPNNFNYRNFSPSWGSDERQLCSPSFNLPIIQVSKTIYGEYREYHTNLDNKSFMNINSVYDSSIKLLKILNFIELNCQFYKPSRVQCEPMLSIRNLYPKKNKSSNIDNFKNYKIQENIKLDDLLNVISLIDGKRDLIEISNFLDLKIEEIINITEILLENDIIKNSL